MSLIMLAIGTLLALGEGVDRGVNDIVDRSKAAKNGELWYSDSFGRGYLVSNNHRCDITIRNGRKVLVDQRTGQVVHDYTKEYEDKREHSKREWANEISEKNKREREKARAAGQEYYISEEIDDRITVKHNRRVSDNMIVLIRNVPKYDYKESFIGVFTQGHRVGTRYYFKDYIEIKSLPMSYSRAAHLIYNNYINDNYYNLNWYPEDADFIKSNNIRTEKISYEDFMKKYKKYFIN